MDFHTESYQYFPHKPSQLLGPGSQDSILLENGMPIDSHNTERIDSGSSKTSAESMTGGIFPELLITCLKSVSCCGRPVDNRSMELVILERDRRTSLGFLIKKQFLKSSIQEMSESSGM